MGERLVWIHNTIYFTTKFTIFHYTINMTDTFILIQLILYNVIVIHLYDYIFIIFLIIYLNRYNQLSLKVYNLQDIALNTVI